MIYAIAKIDNSSRARLSWIQSFAASFGIVPRPIYGHITLCALAQQDIPGCKTALAGQRAFSVDIESVGLLPNQPVIGAMASRNSPLEEIRRTLAQDCCWTPHVELLYDRCMDLNWIRSAMTQMFTPFTAAVSRIEFVRDTGKGFEVLDAVDLISEN